MTFNFADLQQKVDRLLYNITEQNRRAYQLFYDPTPQDVGLPQLDENGNLITVKIPNRAKIKAEVDSLISGAKQNIKSWWSRTFYVDAENGDDNNPGTQDAPFKTLQKAIDSIPVGGKGKICIIGRNIVINQTINMVGKNIILDYLDLITSDEHKNGNYHLIFTGGGRLRIGGYALLGGISVKPIYWKVEDANYNHLVDFRYGHIFFGGYYSFDINFAGSKPQYLLLTSYNAGDNSDYPHSHIKFISASRLHITTAHADSRLVFYDYAGKVLSHFWQCTFPTDYDNTTSI